MQEPVISVVIPAYNAERWIRESLASAQEQTVREIEILVVDDGSKDSTASIVLEAARADPRIRLIQIENGGVGVARNAGIQASKGKYIAPLDADDLWHRSKLEKQTRRFEELGEHAGLVYCWYQYIDERGNGLAGAFPFTIEGDTRKAIILRNFVGNASVPMFRAVALRSVGFYLTREEQGGVQGCEDWDLSIRIAERWQVGVAPEVLVGYRRTALAMSTVADGMSRSYRLVMDRARQRNPDLPRSLFRWSNGHFQRYLASKSYSSCDYRSCVKSAGRALSADPVLALDKMILKLALKSAVCLVTGARKTPRPPRRRASSSDNADPLKPGVVKRSLLTSVQERRWEQVLTP